MTILHTQCLPTELAKPPSQAVIAATFLGCDDQPLTPGEKLVKCSDVPAAQTLTLAGQTLSLSGGGGSVVLPDSDDQQLSISGNVISLTDGGSVTLPTTAAPVPQVLSIAGNTVSLSGGGGTVTLPAATIATQDEGTALSASVNTLNFVGAGVTASGAGGVTTVTVPGACASLQSATAGAATVAAAGDKYHVVDSAGNCQVRTQEPPQAYTVSGVAGGSVHGTTGAFNFAGFSSSSVTFTIGTNAIVIAREEGMMNTNADGSLPTGGYYFVHSQAQISIDGGAYIGGDDSAHASSNDLNTSGNNTGGPNLVHIVTLPAGTHTIAGRVGVAPISNPSNLGPRIDSSRLTVTILPIG